MHNLFQDMRYSFRQLYKSRGPTVIVLATLALGIGANTAIFSVVNSVSLRPLPYKDSERLVSIEETKLPQFPDFPVSPGNFLEWKKRNTVFENIVAARYVTRTLTGVGDAENLKAGRVSEGYFSTLSTKFHLGRDFTADQYQFGQSNVCILSYKLWQKRFGGDTGILGKPITLDNQVYSVIGIASEQFSSLTHTDLWTPMAFTPDERQLRRFHYMAAIGKLKAGVTIEQARKEMSLIADQIANEYPENKGWNIKIRSLLDAYVGDIKTSLYLALGAVGFVLLIVCANIANLLLARAISQRKEIAIRVTLGAGRLQIIRQLLTESMLLSLLGGAMGITVAFFGVKLLLALAPEDIARMDGVSIDDRALVFTAVMTLLTGLIIGMVPALQASKPDLNDALKDASRGSTEAGSRRIIRNSLVVFEIAMSLALLISAGLLMKSFLILRRVDPGIKASNIVNFGFTLPEAKYPLGNQQASFHEQLVEKVSSLPGVKFAAVSNGLPLLGGFIHGFYIEGRPKSTDETLYWSTTYCAVSSDYFKTMGIPVLKGRVFTERDNAGAARVAVISESMAKKYFPNEDPIGKYINVTNGPETFREIVGVVGDIKRDVFQADSMPQTYDPYLQQPYPSMSLVVKVDGNPAAVIGSVRNAVKSIDKDQPISKISTYEQVISDLLAQQRFSATLMGIFASLAMVIAAIGVYGVMNYSVSHRVYEMGIRISLGAERRDILKLVVGHGLLLAVIGIVIGMGGAYFATRYLESMLFHITRTDPMIFISIPLIILIVALAACYFPARRAANVDPMILLRED